MITDISVDNHIQVLGIYYYQIILTHTILVHFSTMYSHSVYVLFLNKMMFRRNNENLKKIMNITSIIYSTLFRNLVTIQLIQILLRW
jgi:hypothetical protein